MDLNPNPLYSLDSNGAPNWIRRMEEAKDIYNVESQLIRGTMSFSKDKLQELDPSYTGYSHVFVLRLPPVMTNPANGYQVDGYEDNGIQNAQFHCRNLKALLEMGCTSYSGTPSLSLQTSEVSIGWSERSYPAPTISAYDGKQFTLRCLETRGEPLRRALEYYISGVSDPNVKAAMLNGALDVSRKMLLEPTLSNFTFTIMVVQTDQTLLTIQDISLWNSCIITDIDRSNLDWENGTVDIVQPRELQFTGVYMPDARNKLIDKKAQVLLGRRLQFYKRYRDMSEQDIGTQHWQAGDSSY